MDRAASAGAGVSVSRPTICFSRRCTPCRHVGAGACTAAHAGDRRRSPGTCRKARSSALRATSLQSQHGLGTSAARPHPHIEVLAHTSTTGVRSHLQLFALRNAAGDVNFILRRVVRCRPRRIPKPDDTQHALDFDHCMCVVGRPCTCVRAADMHVFIDTSQEPSCRWPLLPAGSLACGCLQNWTTHLQVPMCDMERGVPSATVSRCRAMAANNGSNANHLESALRHPPAAHRASCYTARAGAVACMPRSCGRDGQDAPTDGGRVGDRL